MSDPPGYRPRIESRSSFVPIRGLRYHVRHWGDPADPPLVMLHGGRDASATFQFVVDAFRSGHHVMAPDWRGHGQSGWAAEGYAFADYLADLDALLGLLSPERPIALVGHSLGGNVACVYAGLRPERVSHLVSLDGFGLPDRPASGAPAHLRRWLDAQTTEPAHRTYPDLDSMAARLRAANPRLGGPRSPFMAAHLSRPVDGGYVWAFDPRHKLPFAALHRYPEWEACVRAITAPVLWIGSGTTFPPSLDGSAHPLADRVALTGATFRRLAGTGHNLHHDAPEAVARLIEDFLAEARPPLLSGRRVLPEPLEL